MKRLYFSLMLGLLTTMILCTCTEVIDFATERAGGQLVVDGNITTGNGPFELYLGTTAELESRTIPVDDAQVTLFDTQGNSEAYQGIGEGKYLLEETTVPTEIGSSYYIQIELPDGRTYESRPEKLPPIFGQLDSVYFEFGQEQEVNTYGNVTTFPVVQALVDMSMSPQGEQTSYFRFDVEEVYALSPTDFPDPFGAIPPQCFVYDYPNAREFLLTDVIGDGVPKLQQLRVAKQKLDWRFDERHYFNVYLQSLTEEAYIYWSQIYQTISGVGTIFDAPPAPVRGNITNINNPNEQVLGYFGAVTRDTIRDFLLPEDTPFRATFECQFYFFINDYPARCLDCLSVPNSTYQKPDYF